MKRHASRRTGPVCMSSLEARQLLSASVMEQRPTLFEPPVVEAAKHAKIKFPHSVVGVYNGRGAGSTIIPITIEITSEKVVSTKKAKLKANITVQDGQNFFVFSGSGYVTRSGSVRLDFHGSGSDGGRVNGLVGSNVFNGDYALSSNGNSSSDSFDIKINKSPGG